VSPLSIETIQREPARPGRANTCPTRSAPGVPPSSSRRGSCPLSTGNLSWNFWPATTSKHSKGLNSSGLGPGQLDP
jgi:hypothetical protein